MRPTVRLITAFLMTLCLATPLAGAEKKKVVFLAGGPSHGFGAHDHLAGCHLLAKRLNDANLNIEATVIQGWPKDESVLDGAAAIVMYSDGGGGHFAVPHIKKLDELNEKGAGIGAIHYAVEVVRGTPGKHWLKWMGGYFETNWSVNPHWDGNFTKFPQHPAAGGVRPFMTNDEWYYNMRFRDGMKGVTPVLSAVPPDSTRQQQFGTHSGNPEVRKGVGKNQAEHVLWVSENENGSRGFGTTGGHVHWNWAQDDWRKAVLNSVAWIAKVDVPSKGVESTRPTVDEMMQNNDEPIPKNFNKDEIAKKIEAMNKPREASAAAAGK
jgi:hypothetical protein